PEDDTGYRRCLSRLITTGRLVIISKSHGSLLEAGMVLRGPWLGGSPRDRTGSPGVTMGIAGHVFHRVDGGRYAVGRRREQAVDCNHVGVTGHVDLSIGDSGRDKFGDQQHLVAAGI